MSVYMIVNSDVKDIEPSRNSGSRHRNGLKSMAANIEHLDTRIVVVDGCD